ncbi:hypothetical protein BaRGS_00008577, partial [Batillaria attramentaria]
VVSVTAQFPPTDLPSTCASTTCLVGTTCKEVLRPTSGVITGQCLNNVQPTGNENVCGQVGQPLYTLRSGQTVEAFCGRGPSRMDCPSGYQCNIAPNDAYAVCCPSAGGGSTKPGQCPAPVTDGSVVGICANTCSVDSDCSGALKCCRNECGATTCQQPMDAQPVSACAAMLCPRGTRCVEQQVQCIRAPCPPQASCVPVEKPVCQPPCGPDYDCKWQRSGYCFFGYCPTQAQCVLRPRCPFYPAWINPNCVRRDDCSTSDPNACSNGLICCSTDCGRRCVRPQ